MIAVLFAAVISLVELTASSPIRRVTSPTCSSYTIINTRGTGERQGESSGFRSMNQAITSALSGGVIVNTVYPAGFNQDSSEGTEDIINNIQSGLSENPDQCFILEGYSQGAAATVNAMPELTGDAFDAVRGVFLIGNPLRQPGLACNVDSEGGGSTADSRGIQGRLGQGIPDEWVGKTLDVCDFGDGVCDTSSGFGITAQHLSYPRDDNVQDMGTDFVVQQLGG